MQRLLMLLLALCGQVSAMEQSLSNVIINMPSQVKEASTIMIAAWVVTPKTVLDVHDEIIISKYPNGMHGIKHFSRPKGLRETRCELTSVRELASLGENAVHEILLKHTGDQFNLVLPEQAWYKHPLATHSIAILSTILLMGALFR